MPQKEAVIFVGIQAVGKSSFYKERFFDTHIRINLDMLATRHREELLLRACIAAEQSFVVDNTNVLIRERARYIEWARPAGFRVTGYYFPSKLQDALARNRLRRLEQPIPDMGVIAKYGSLQPPSLEEGFDAIYTVRMVPEQGFEVQLLAGGN